MFRKREVRRGHKPVVVKKRRIVSEEEQGSAWKNSGSTLLGVRLVHAVVCSYLHIEELFWTRPSLSDISPTPYRQRRSPWVYAARLHVKRARAGGSWPLILTAFTSIRPARSSVPSLPAGPFLVDGEGVRILHPKDFHLFG